MRQVRKCLLLQILEEFAVAIRRRWTFSRFAEQTDGVQPSEGITPFEPQARDVVPVCGANERCLAVRGETPFEPQVRICTFSSVGRATDS